MYGLSKTTFYERIRCGLIPPPFALGGFAKGWWQHELIVIITKLIAGADNEELKAAVLELLEQRKSLSPLEFEPEVLKLLKQGKSPSLSLGDC